MAMSNMNKNRNNAKVTDKQSAKKPFQGGKKLYQGEFGSEFDFDGASAQANNVSEAQEKTASRQPVSERTAWH